jgi:hypothetical protein
MAKAFAMDTGPSSVETELHGAHDAPHTPGHDDAFYATSNPKYFGLPLGVLIAAAVSAISVAITLVKFLGGTFLNLH